MNYEAFEVGPGTTQSAFNGSSVDHHCRNYNIERVRAWPE
jgi:hypothetical protein